MVSKLYLFFVLHVILLPERLHFGPFKGYLFFLPIVLVIAWVVETDGRDEVYLVASVDVGGVDTDALFLNSVTEKKVHLWFKK